MSFAISSTRRDSTLSRAQPSFDRIASVAKSLAKPGILCNNPAHSFVIIDAVDEFYPSNWATSGQADKDEVEI